MASTSSRIHTARQTIALAFLGILLTYILYPAIFVLPFLIGWRMNVIPEDTTVRCWRKLKTPGDLVGRHYEAYAYYLDKSWYWDPTGLQEEFVSYWDTGRHP